MGVRDGVDDGGPRFFDVLSSGSRDIYIQYSIISSTFRVGALATFRRLSGRSGTKGWKGGGNLEGLEVFSEREARARRRWATPQARAHPREDKTSSRNKPHEQSLCLHRD